MDVITIGSLTLDAFAFTDRSELVGDKLAYPLGTKLRLDELSFSLGGGATNAAAVFSALGRSVAVSGKVGRDFVGDEILRRLSDLNIDFVGERCDDSSAFSIVLDAINHDRTVLAHKGASENPLCSTIPSADLYYVTSPGPSALDTYVERLESLDGLVVFNASSYLTVLGFERLKPLLSCIDVLICNEEEFIELNGSLDFSRVHDLGVDTVVVTLGAQGAMVSRDRVIRARARPTNVVETTGAGDSFGATFADALMRDLPLDRALDRALTMSASVISFMGPKNGILTATELDRVMAQLPPLVIE